MALANLMANLGTPVTEEVEETEKRPLMDEHVEARFQRIEGILEDTATRSKQFQRDLDDSRLEFSRKASFLIDILRETLTASRETTKRLDLLEADLDHFRNR